MLNSEQIKLKFERHGYSAGAFNAYANVFVPIIILLAALSCIGRLVFMVPEVTLAKDFILLIAAIIGVILVRRLDAIGQIYNLLFLIFFTASSLVQGATTCYQLTLVSDTVSDSAAKADASIANVTAIIGGFVSFTSAVAIFTAIVITLANIVFGILYIRWFIKCSRVFMPDKSDYLYL